MPKITFTFREPVSVVTNESTTVVTLNVGQGLIPSVARMREEMTFTPNPPVDIGLPADFNYTVVKFPVAKD